MSSSGSGQHNKTAMSGDALTGQFPYWLQNLNKHEIRVFNFGYKKISEPTEKGEISEISVQIQIEFNFFTKN
jgi:hypothetical protein